jgi:hypothetical protein
MKHQSPQEFYGKMAIKYIEKNSEIRVRLSKEKDSKKIKMGMRILQRYAEAVIYWTCKSWADMQVNGQDQKAMQTLTQIVLSKGMERQNVLN